MQAQPPPLLASGAAGIAMSAAPMANEEYIVLNRNLFDSALKLLEHEGLPNFGRGWTFSQLLAHK